LTRREGEKSKRKLLIGLASSGFRSATPCPGEEKVMNTLVARRARQSLDPTRGGKRQSFLFEGTASDRVPGPQKKKTRREKQQQHVRGGKRGKKVKGIAYMLVQRGLRKNARAYQKSSVFGKVCARIREVKNGGGVRKTLQGKTMLNWNKLAASRALKKSWGDGARGGFGGCSPATPSDEDPAEPGGNTRAP